MTKRAQPHRFILRPVIQRLFLKHEVTVQVPRKRVNGKLESTCPRLQLGGRDYAPLFGSISEDVRVRELTRFEPRAVAQRESNTPIYIPKPNSKSRFCSICKHKYEDYLTHIHTNDHVIRLRNCPFQAYIAEMVPVHKIQEQNFQDEKDGPPTNENNECHQLTFVTFDNKDG